MSKRKLIGPLLSDEEALVLARAFNGDIPTGPICDRLEADGYVAKTKYSGGYIITPKGRKKYHEESDSRGGFSKLVTKFWGQDLR